MKYILKILLFKIVSIYIVFVQPILDKFSLNEINKIKIVSYQRIYISTCGHFGYFGSLRRNIVSVVLFL